MENNIYILYIQNIQYVSMTFSSLVTEIIQHNDGDIYLGRKKNMFNRIKLYAAKYKRGFSIITNRLVFILLMM